MIDVLSLTLGGIVGYAIGAGVSRSGSGSDSVTAVIEDRRQELRGRYESGPMDYVEFGDQIAVLEDPGTEQIMREAITVDGVGPETAFEIAREFDGEYSEFRDADRDDLVRVNGVGENRAGALMNR